MAEYGFHASHEQISPGRLLEDVRGAERAGFRLAMCSDHFAPWSVRQGHSGAAWPWLGAALAQMFPGRFWVALGSGQNMNEHVTGDAWPAKQLRQERLEECVHVIRGLLDGREVSHRGLVEVDRARLYSLPDTPPPLLGPALSPATAARAAGWADGLITVNSDEQSMRSVVRAYRDAGGRGPLALQVHLSIADTLGQARDLARDQWQNHAVDEPLASDLATPEELDIAGRFIPDEEIAGSVIVTDSVDELVGRLRGFEEMGFEQIYLHHVARDQTPFLKLAENELLPELHSSR